MGKNKGATKLDMAIAEYIHVIETQYGSGKAYLESTSVINDAGLGNSDNIVTIEKINKLTYPTLFETVWLNTK